MPAIRHTVAFALPYPEGSGGEAEFLRSARELASLPGVEDFVVLRRIGEGDQPWSLSMRFADQVAYDGYNEHPVHRTFVETAWLPTVTSFTEADFLVVDPPATEPEGTTAAG